MENYFTISIMMILKTTIAFSLLFVIVFLSEFSAALTKKKTCEVCVGVIDKVLNRTDKADHSNQTVLEENIKQYCGGAKGKEERFCYAIGARPDSATYIMNEVTKPLTWGKPADRVCEELNTKNDQICRLEYDKPVDWEKLDSLRPGELKKILSDWGESCQGCTEKSEFVKRVKELMHKYVPDKVKKEL